jgi:hypothetical protein
MPNRRPTSVLVIAALQLVIGGIGIICSACGAAGSAIGDKAAFQGGGANNPDQVKMQEATKKLEEKTKEIEEQKVPGKRVYEIVNQVMGWVLSIALIVSGIGLLKMQGWARALAIVYAVVSLLHKVVIAIYTIAFMNPAAQEALQQIPAEDQKTLEMITNFAFVFTYVLIFGTMIYPIIVLIVMLLPSVARAFRPYDPDRDLGGADDREDYRDPPALDDES